ncbi:MAG: hypothetical protein ACFE8F_12010 [Promethearchaeota archaeon]
MTHEDAFREAFHYLYRYEEYCLLRALSMLIVYLGVGFYLTSPSVMVALAMYLLTLFEQLELPCAQENNCLYASSFWATNIQLVMFLVFALVFVTLILPTVRSLMKPTAKLNPMMPQRLGSSVSWIWFFTTFHNFIVVQLYEQFHFRVMEVWGVIPFGGWAPYYNNPLLVPIYTALVGYLIVSTIILTPFFGPVVGVIWTMRVLQRAIPKAEFPELRKLKKALIILAITHLGIYLAIALIMGPLFWVVYQVPQLMQFIQEYLYLILFNTLFAVTLGVYIITGWQLHNRAEQVLEDSFSKKGIDSEGFDESGEPLPEW